MTEPIFIFISYRSLDRAKVDAICSRLRGERNPDGTPRYKIWQDKHDIIEGHDWWQSIMDAIEQCDVFLFMVSQEAVRSEVCKTEIRHASACNRPILPLILPDEFQYKGADRFIPYHAEMPSEIIGRKAHYLFHEGEGYVAQVNRSVDGFMAEANTRWRFTKPLYRPLDPNATTAQSHDVISVYDEACDYAYRPEFDRAVLLFQRVIQLDDPDFADDADGWIKLLGEYRRIAESYVRLNTRPNAERRWPAYVASFPRPFLKTVFDPKRIGAQISGEDIGADASVHQTSPQIPPHTGEGVKPQGQTPVAQPQKSATQPPLEQKPTPPAQQTPPLPTERGLGGEVAPKPDPVQEALTRAREFHKTGTRNKDWTPFYVIFPDIKRKGFDEAKGKGLEMRFCVVPTGTFQMGSEEYKPIHQQTFNQLFYIAQTPVTNAQWKVAVAAKAVNEPVGEASLKWYNDPAMANAPVVGVSWFECQKFTTWAGCRLPTEREWEYAARGIESLRYPWGNDWDENKAVWSGNSGGQPNDVSSKPDGASWVGTLHQSGNVWEWCASLYDSYPYPTDGSREVDTGNRTDVLRVLRGGAWRHANINKLRAACRGDDWPFRLNNRGFRVVRS